MTDSSSSSPLLPPETLQAASRDLQTLCQTLGEVLFGQEALIEQVVIGLTAGGHILLEGLPGLGKTELVKSLAKALALSSRRIQFTPDLLPGDITGNPMLEETPEGRRFVFQPGPVFTNLLLADEINRASPKTQSALLEAMQESRVSAMGETHPLPKPFFVLATQNPIELEGTYPLPEAQLDRFLFKLEVTRNRVEVLEKIIGRRHIGEEVVLPQLWDGAHLLHLMSLVNSIHLPEKVIRWIARLVDGTHGKETATARQLRFGASPRAALGMAAAARARALLKGRGHASFEDVEAIAVPVLAHRIIPGYEARLEGQTGTSLVHQLVQEVTPTGQPLPRTLEATPT